MRLMILLLFLALSILLPNSLRAQVAMKLEMSRRNYLLYEKIYAKVTLRNDSGMPLLFGKHKKLQGRLYFEITNKNNELIKPLKGTSIFSRITGSVIQPGAIKSFIIPVSDYYNLQKTDGYRIKAALRHAQLPNEYESNSEAFGVSEGLFVWQRTVGVPKLVGEKADSKIKTRTYTIRCLFDGSRKVIYLLVEDPRLVYSVNKLGYETSNEKPECETDMFNRLHILFPVSAKLYNYYIYDINGQLDKKEVFMRTTTIPMLAKNPKNGNVIVAGGQRASKDIDYVSADEKPF